VAGAGKATTSGRVSMSRRENSLHVAVVVAQQFDGDVQLFRHLIDAADHAARVPVVLKVAEQVNDDRQPDERASRGGEARRYRAAG
jgi:hypothetical protein